MSRHFYFAWAVLLGLLMTQMLASLQVYLSDIELHDAVRAIAQAGYLTVPNHLIQPSLKALGPAFLGALFFTLSLGAGLSIASAACAWLWDRLLRRNRAVFPPFLVLWLGAAAAANRQGFSPLEGSYFLFVPPLVFAATLRWMPAEKGKGIWPARLAHLLPIALAAVIWTANADRLLFLNIRDFLLLSNPAGRAVNDFYYRYTLYPAEAFKTLDQKTLKTCRISSISDESLFRSVKRALLDHDYIPAKVGEEVDLEVGGTAEGLVFRHKSKAILQVDPGQFIKDPGRTLRDFSTKTDRHAFFRQTTIVSLLVGFPVLLYVIVFVVLRLLLLLCLEPMPALLATSVLCFVIAVALLIPIRLVHIPLEDDRAIAKAMASERWQQRVAALRAVVAKGADIGRFDDYGEMISSPHLPVRYWLSKALGISRGTETVKDLLVLLDDPQPNVVCIAMEGLGRRGDRNARERILQEIESSRHWYVQWYAYRALKDLGWRQISPGSTGESGDSHG